MKRFFLLTSLAVGLTVLNLGGPAGCGSGTPAAQCGDGVISGGEICDGGALNGETCGSQGFSSEGTLKCASDCGSFDTSGCAASGSVLWLTQIASEGDDSASGSNVHIDESGRLFANVSFRGTALSADGKSLANPGTTVPHPALGEVDPDSGAFDWLDPFFGNGTSGDSGGVPAFDSEGNVYVSGSFYGTALTAADKTLPNVDLTGTTGDSYEGKLNPYGTLAWLTPLASASSDQTSLVADSLGNLYVQGFFIGATLTVDGKTLNNPDLSGNTGDGLVGKINPSDGTLAWLTGFSSDSFDSVFVSTDEAGNVYVGGNFQGKTLTAGGKTLTNADPGGTTSDSFVGKIDTSNGTLVWLTGFSSAQVDFINQLVLDPTGNLYVRGSFFGATLTASGKTLSNAGSMTADGFAAKINTSDGTLDWLTGFSSDQQDFVFLVTDPSGNLYASGNFQGSMLSAGGKTLSNAGSMTSDGFAGRINTSDGTLAWLNGFSSDGNDGAFAVTDPSGRLYVAGNFNGTALTAGGKTLTNGGATTFDVFVARYEPDGTLDWLDGISSDKNDSINIVTDSSGRLYATGDFQGATLAAADRTLSNADGGGTTKDAFVGRLDPADGRFLWLNAVSSLSDDQADLVPDTLGHLYLVGSFKGTTLSAAGQTLTNVDSSGTTRDAFVGRIAP
jgi:hypothetical protein